MYYEFQDANGDDISSNQDKAVLIKQVHSYYKGVAIDNDSDDYEIVGNIITYNQFDEVINTELYYAYGGLPSRSNESPYQQSEFV